MLRNRKKTFILGLAGSILATAAVGENGCGESELLIRRNKAAESEILYNSPSKNAELRGLAAFSFDRLLSEFDGSKIKFVSEVLEHRIDPDRSLFIRDLSLLEAFTFAELMETLAVGTEAPVPAGLNLFKDWWRTAGPPEEGRDMAIGCTDTLINGLTYTCPNHGGLRTLADIESFDNVEGDPPPFRIMAVVNRGDLWDFETDSADCGEYRIIVGADNDGESFSLNFERGRFLFNFEAVLRRGENGPGFCKAVQKLWASFSVNTEDADVAGQLRKFYLERNGLTLGGGLVAPTAKEADFVFGPVVAPSNFGLDGEVPEAGQIRTNTKLGTDGDKWMLREYRVRRLSGTGLRIIPVGLAATPPKIAAFAGTKLNKSLANVLEEKFEGIDTTLFDELTFDPPDDCLDAAESFGHRDSIRTRLQRYFTGTVENKVVSVLGNMPNPKLDVRMRANNLELTTCAGCHSTAEKSSLRHLTTSFGNSSMPESVAERWKGAVSFHFARFNMEPGQNPIRYKLQAQMARVFLPKREYLMRTVIDGKPPKRCADLSDLSRKAFSICTGPNRENGEFYQ